MLSTENQASESWSDSSDELHGMISFADIFRNSIFKSIMASTQKYFLKENILLPVNLTFREPMFDDQDIRI